MPIHNDTATGLYKILKPILHLPDNCLSFTLEVEYGQPVKLTTQTLVTYEEEDQEIVSKSFDVTLTEEVKSQVEGKKL